MIFMAVDLALHLFLSGSQAMLKAATAGKAKKLPKVAEDPDTSELEVGLDLFNPLYIDLLYLIMTYSRLI